MRQYNRQIKKTSSSLPVFFAVRKKAGYEGGGAKKGGQQK